MDDSSPQNSKSPIPVVPTKAPENDQHFLLYFIAGIYFGPNLKGETAPKSALQRLAEKLPPYTSDQLAGSLMKMVEVERIFYYVLRKADESLIMKMSLLHQFFQGKFPSQGRDTSSPQFPDLFPLELHPHTRSKNWYRYIESLLFINNPEVYYLNPEDVERFKRLTGLNDFFLDRDAARSHNSSARKASLNVEATENRSNKEFSPLKDDQQHDLVTSPVRSVPYNGNLTPPHTNSDSNLLEKKFGPAMLFLPGQPSEEDWANLVAATNTGFALTGTAAMGNVGPIIGSMDIGECEDSYLFRVSLPGVKRDPCGFNCEVEKDGRVVIKGVTTTGERTVKKHSQVFEMVTHNLCPPGEFSLSFQLPGPVDPQHFLANFDIAGILEGVVMKDLQS
ncbi:increased DNA methylation 2 [Cucumis sativus]|uniref:SHSP domain-containing protein n=1 Tax=Cucumis sativus TaxID=3659 RepID=A0A0A0LJJ8_CUCSA|nr:increased DNA methylation 2 [Cucumis sativus]XP_011648802.1 increased DNA methylation 2 [Cucumis sativus]